MKTRLFIAIAAVTLLSYAPCIAQKKVNVRFEQIKTQCEGVPPEKRLTITVARFNVTTPNTGGEFGDNMATMLSNALQQVHCYNVLSLLRNKDDNNKELDYGESDYANKKTAPKKGKQLGAQVVVTGEVTEFNKNTSTIGAGPFKKTREIVKLGFVIQLQNPQTREIIASKSVNVEGNSSASTSIGVGVPYVGRLNFGEGSKNSPAVANALEQGIIEAVEAISAMKEEYHIEPIGMVAGLNSTSITISNASYETLTEFGNLLKGLTTVKSTDPALNDNVVVIAVEHDGSTNELLAEIQKKAGGKYKVAGLKEGEIKLAVK